VSVIKAGGRERECLTEVILFQFWVFGKKLRSIRICRHRLKDPPNSQSHASDARLPIHHGGISGDSIK
jgi:hypothetical protein